MNYKEYINEYVNYLSIDIIYLDTLTVYFSDCNSNDDLDVKNRFINDVSAILTNEQMDSNNYFLISFSSYLIDNTSLNQYKRTSKTEFELLNSSNIIMEGKLAKLNLYKIDSIQDIRRALDFIFDEQTFNNFLIRFTQDEIPELIDEFKKNMNYFALSNKNNNLKINVNYLISRFNNKIIGGYGNCDFGQYAIVTN